MAKIKAVYKSNMHLTEVQIAGAAAKYFFDSYTSGPPQPGMEVDISGFDYNLNNGQTVIQTVNLGPPDWFTVLHLGQLAEVHGATAHAQSATGVTCAIIPKPSKDQAIIKTHNSNGCVFHSKKKKPKKGSKSRTVIWTPIMGCSVFDLTRAVIRCQSIHWKRTLSTTHRTDWNSWAAGATIYSYDGKTHTPTGFQAYMRASKSDNFLYNNPHYTFGTSRANSYRLPPTVPFADLGPPEITETTRFGDGLIGVKFANIPHTDDLFALLTVALPGKNLDRKSSWFMGYNYDATVSWLNPNWYSFYKVDFPFFPENSDQTVQCSLSYYDAATCSWGDYSYFAI